MYIICAMYVCMYVCTCVPRALLHSANADLHSSSAKFSLGLPTNAVRLRSCNRAVADPRFHDFRQVTVKNSNKVSVAVRENFNPYGRGTWSMRSFW